MRQRKNSIVFLCFEFFSSKMAENKQDEVATNSIEVLEPTNSAEEEEEEEEKQGTGVVVAFAEEVEDDRYLFRSFFPSKIGGKPAWLNPQNIPKEKDLRCENCKKTLHFLLQVLPSPPSFPPSPQRNPTQRNPKK